MIPEGDSDFERKYPNRDTLLRYGFESVEEYNSFRYSDYCFRSFLEAAQKEAYFHNTIFVFVGDHGVAGNAAAMYPPAWTEQRLTDEHVPLLFYAPYLLAPQRRPEVVSQIDVLPTIAGMLHQPYINSTLGRDLLHPDKQNHYAFITNTAGRIGIVTDQYYFNTHLNFPDDQLVPITELAPGHSPQQQDSIRRELAEFTHAFFETARYLLMNNRPE
jgi:phosphoglycerol transferase MdoB-like AlkP superfamily enzyme